MLIEKKIYFINVFGHKFSIPIKITIIYNKYYISKHLDETSHFQCVSSVISQCIPS